MSQLWCHTEDLKVANSDDLYVSLQKVGRMYFLNFGVEGLNCSKWTPRFQRVWKTKAKLYGRRNRRYMEKEIERIWKKKSECVFGVEVKAPRAKYSYNLLRVMNAFCVWVMNAFCVWVMNAFCVWVMNEFCVWVMNEFCVCTFRAFQRSLNSMSKLFLWQIMQIKCCFSKADNQVGFSCHNHSFYDPSLCFLKNIAFHY